MNQLDKTQFGNWLTILSEQCKQPLSTPTVSAYYNHFNGKLSTEQFVNSAQRLFEQGGDRLPSPIEWTKLARALTPDLALSPSPETPGYEDLDEVQREALRVEIDRVRALVVNSTKSRPDLVRIGELVNYRNEGTESKLEMQLERMNAWLKADDVLRKEAIAWAVSRPEVELVQNELGEVSEFRLAEELSAIDF